MTLSYRAIPLSGNRGAGKVALVDERDYARLSQFKWQWLAPSSAYCAGHEGYIYRRERWSKRTIYMHREIMNPPVGMEVDHIRIGSGLDNRRSNLRIVSHAENMRNRRLLRSNTSGYRGVAWHKMGRKWKASIEVRGRYYHLGLFATQEEAAAAYETARERLGLLKSQSDS